MDTRQSDPLDELIKAGLVIAGVISVTVLLDHLISAKRRRSSYRQSHIILSRTYNDLPLPRTKKVAVLLRDDFQCVYCGIDVGEHNAHIDHRRSRFNGGTNHMNNLATSCAPCNLAKGSMNARQFQRRLARSW